ncbi:MAG TPA: LysR family transcriptional regulator [Polyangiaceae bacterium]|nr:LysR family transcriptional regulator [Polyangiaceae bacterium]
MLSPRHLPLIATFVQVCRDGSFTKAAHSLSLSKSLVSTHLRLLEEALGARLLERTTRRLALTQTGHDVLTAADRMLCAANEVAQIAESKQEVPRGVLRVAAPVDLGALLVAPAVARLCSLYPELRAELVLTDEKTDLIAHRLDAMLSVNVPKDSRLVSTQLGEDMEIIVAAPRLARRWRAANQPKDLAGAPWIAHPAIPASNRHQFRNTRGALQRLAPKEARILANTGDAIRSLVVGGAGFAVVPAQMVADDLQSGRMVHVLPEWRGRKVLVHACIPSGTHPPARVTLFLQELRSAFRATGFEAQYAAGAPRHPLRHSAP